MTQASKAHFRRLPKKESTLPPCRHEVKEEGVEEEEVEEEEVAEEGVEGVVEQPKRQQHQPQSPK